MDAARPSHYVFNHIPKTGGTSLMAICRQNVPAAETSPFLMDGDLRQARDNGIERYRLITGHFSLLAQSQLSRSRYSMTLLRDPIRTIVSTYSFWRRVPEQTPTTSKAKELSFADFVRYFADSPAIIQNPYTHHFAALGRDFPDDPRDTSSLLAAAKHNLAAFNFIGICEEYERSARLLCRELGWQLPEAIPHENRSFSENELSRVDAATMEILRDRNRLDRELYEYGIELFHRREQEGGPGPDVEPNRFVPFPLPYAPDRQARIEAVTAAWLPTGPARLLEVGVKFRVRVRNPELIAGVAISDAAGMAVWGTNTYLERQELDIGENCECRAAFVVEIEAPPGMYSVTAALHDLRRHGFHDHWIDRATCFEVAAQPGGPPDTCRVRLHEFRSTVERECALPVSADRGG